MAFFSSAAGGATIAAIISGLAALGTTAMATDAQKKAAGVAAATNKPGFDAEGNYTPVAATMGQQGQRPPMGTVGSQGVLGSPAVPGVASGATLPMMMSPGGRLEAKQSAVASPAIGAPPTPPVRLQDTAPASGQSQDKSPFSQTLRDSQLAVQIGTQLMQMGQSMRPPLPQARGMLPAAGGTMQPTAGQFQTMPAPRLAAATQGGMDPRLEEMRRRMRLGGMYG